MIAFLLCLCVAVGDFGEGLEAYQADRYAEARAHFEELWEESTETSSEGAVLYNLGNCAFRMGESPEAIAFYAGALRRMPHAEEPLGNLNLARRELGLPAIPPPEIDPFARFDSLPAPARLAIVGGMQLLALIGLWLGRTRAVRVAMFCVLGIALYGAVHLGRWNAGSSHFDAVTSTDAVSYTHLTLPTKRIV